MQAEAVGDEYDAASAMLERGGFLRKLREMEHQDEEERSRETVNIPCSSGEDDDTAVLDCQSYLANQSYYDDYKHVNYKSIDFGLVGDKYLTIQQDRNVGKGGFVWDAGFILAEYLIQSRDWTSDDRSTKMIELGAGTGVTGLMLATVFSKCHVHLTDLPQLQPLLERNANEFQNASVGAVLEWGSAVSMVDTYDVIVGADVVASIYDSSGLAKTIYDLSNEQTQVYLAYGDRLAGIIEKFEEHLRQLFVTVERRTVVSSNKNPSIWISYASGRRNDQ